MDRLFNTKISISRVKFISIIFIIIGLLLTIISGTYAYQSLSINNNSMTGMGGCFEVYYQGQQITSQNLVATDNYLNGASTTISLSKDSSCKLYNIANIYINTNTTTTAPVETIYALKYKLFDGSTLIAQGAINTKGSQLITSVPLTDTTVTYTLYVWLDNSLSSGYFDSTNYSGYIYADSTQTSTIPTATFLTGSEVNVKMKNLAGNSDSTTSTVDSNITSILKSTTPPDTSLMTDDNIVSTTDSDFPIYMWYSNGTIYWYSVDDKPNLNTDSKSMFTKMSNLNNISGLANFDTSNVEIMNSFFSFDSSLTSLSALSGWDVSNVTKMMQMFRNTSLTNLDDLENWDVSSLTGTGMGAMFYGCTLLTNLNGLRKWNVSNVTNMTSIFYECSSLTSLEGLENWDVSNVTNLGNIFTGCSSLTSLTALANWNVSNVTSMGGMCLRCSSLTSLKGLEKWNVSNVTNMYQMFYAGYNVTGSLQEVSFINNWDLNSSTNFGQMFYNQPAHPNFTKYQGTWSGGTFTITGS